MQLIVIKTSNFRKLTKVKMKNQVIHQMQQRTQRVMSIKKCSDFKRVLRRLLESQILNDFKAVEQDIINDTQKCTIQLILRHFSKNSTSNFSRSAAYQSIGYCSSSNMRLYCSFIASISYAKCDICSYKEIVNKLTGEIIRKLHVEKGQTCKFLFNLIVANVNLNNETLANALMTSVVQMNELLELSKFKNVEKAKREVRKSFRVCLKSTNSILSYLEKRNTVLKNFNVANTFVRFYLKLYRMFHYKTYIEAVRDVSEFRLVVQILANSVFVFQSHYIMLMRQLIVYWPTAFQYQI